MIAYSNKMIYGADNNYIVVNNDGIQTLSTNALSRDTLVGTDLNKKGNRKDPTPFNYTYSSIKGRVGSYTADRTDYLGKRQYPKAVGRQANYVVLSGPTNDFAETTQVCLDKIYDQLRNNASVLVDIAESGQTLRLLKSTLNLKKFIKSFVTELVFPKGGIVRPKKGVGVYTSSSQKRLDYITNKWLEYRYGWNPLVNSIYDAADNLFRVEEARIIEVKGRSGRMKTHKSPRTGDGTFTSPYVQDITVWGYRSEVKLRFSIPGRGMALTDWTTLNPALLAWELFPFSFVADWVFNISSVLEQFENYWLFKNYFLDGWQSDSYRHDMYRTTYGATYRTLQQFSNGNYVPNQTGTEIQSWLDHNLYRGHRRFLHGTLPYSNQVRIRVKLGAKRQLDAAALIHQIVGKSFR